MLNCEPFVQASLQNKGKVYMSYCIFHIQSLGFPPNPHHEDVCSPKISTDYVVGSPCPPALALPFSGLWQVMTDK